jgi:hypothetical protein
MVAKRLQSGATAYYWDPPTWAKRKGFTLGSEALGGDYAGAKQRCDDVLNPQFDAWLAGSSTNTVAADRPAIGTFDWMVSVYKALPKYTRRPLKTRKFLRQSPSACIAAQAERWAAVRKPLDREH